MSRIAQQASSLTRFGRLTSPYRLKYNDRLKLPVPHVDIVTRQFAPSRLEDHYHTTLADDLMYMTYKHSSGPPKEPRKIRLTYDPEDPYSKYRHNPPVGGITHQARRPPPPSSPDNVIRLEKVQLHIFVKESVANKSNLLPAIMQLRALSGENAQGGGQRAVEGVQIVKAKKAVGGWLRKGIACGAKVDLKGSSMYDFIGTLTEFVLPRLRDFEGIAMPPASSNQKILSAASGVVSFGLPPHAIGFFPQIEVNIDSYPKLFGMHIHFVTNAEGVGAQDRARALVSGFQIPFVRR